MKLKINLTWSLRFFFHINLFETIIDWVSNLKEALLCSFGQCCRKKLRWWTNSARIDRISLKGLNGKKIKSLLAKCHLARPGGVGPIWLSDRNSAKVLIVYCVDLVDEWKRTKRNKYFALNEFETFPKFHKN